MKPGEDNMRKGVAERFGINSKSFLVDSILTIGGAIVNYPDSKKDWKPFAISEGGKLLQQENMDTIISTHTH